MRRYFMPAFVEIVRVGIFLAAGVAMMLAVVGMR
jgi:hypothetical protein